jgi:hypothetical protein
VSVLASPIGLVSIQETADYTSGFPGIFLRETALVRAPGAAQMDGQAQVLPVGGRRVAIVAQMDGHSDMQAPSAFLATGTANMDGEASVIVNSTSLFGGAALMDGLAQAQFASATLASGAANMDGRASEVVAQSVEGAGLAEMDGEASMLAVSPHHFNVAMLDGVTGSTATSLRMTYNRALSQAFVGSQLLKPKLHYHVIFNQVINFPQSISFKMRFVKVMREVAILLTPSIAPHSQFHYTFTTPIYVQPTLAPKWHAVLNLVQNLTVHPATTLKFIWGRTLMQALTISDPLDAHAKYKASLAQLVKLFEVEGLKLRHPVTLSQQLSLSQLLTGGISVKLLQKLLAAGTASPAFHYHLGLTSKVRLAGLIDKLFFEILTQLFTAHDAPTHAFTAIGSLNQLLTLHPSFNNKLILKLVGNIEVSPEQLVHMLYKGDSLLDGVAITALYISPSGTTTAWAVNTRTAAVTEYLNYDFKSFALLGNRYVAAGPGGLYELDGDTDDGALIISDLMGGYLQLNEKKLFGVKGAYVAIRGGGRFYLKLIAGDGREYVYELKAQPNLMTTKVKVGKGISTTYMAWELITEGQDFDLDSIEFIPMTRERRV